MAGLLDFEDPNTAGAMQLGLGLLNAGGPSRMPVSMGQGIAQGGEMAMGAMRQARQDLLKKKLAQLEIEKGQLTMDQVKRELAKDEELKAAFKSSYQSPEQQALAAGGQGPTNEAAAAIPNFSPKLDQKGLMGKLMGIDPVTALKFKEYLEPKGVAVGRDQRYLMPDSSQPNGLREVVSALPEKSATDEAKIKQYKYALDNGYKGSFIDFIKIVPELQGAIMNPFRTSDMNRDERKADYELPPSPVHSVKAPNGTTYTFKDKKSADNFRMKAGVK